MAKPENQFISSVHKYVDIDVCYYEKMANPYRGGTWDVYYEGIRNAMWIEYKFYPKLPPVMNLKDHSKNVALSALQQAWGKRAHNHNRLVGVIVGTPKGGIILPALSYRKEYTREMAEQMLKSRKEIAAWLTKIVSGS